MNQSAKSKGDHKDRPYGGDGDSPVQQCPNCNETISTTAAECPHCGMRLEQAPPLSTGRKNFDFSKISGLRLSIIGVALVVVFLIARDAPFLHPTRGLIVFSLAVIIPILGIIAFVSSVYELIRLGKSDKKPVGRGSVILGLILSILIIIFCVALPYLIMTIGCERHVDPACKNNLKQLGLILNMYANENKDRFPPVDDTKNNFMFEGEVMYPEYLYDVSILSCPNNPDHDPSASQVNSDCLNDESYVYLGWMVMSDEEAEAFFEVYDRLLPEQRDSNILVPEGKGNFGGCAFNRLQMLVDYCYGKDAKIPPLVDEDGFSIIPVMWDRPYTDPAKLSHQNFEDEHSPGSYVLYMDGHVEFVKYGEKFPMTETMARLLEERPRTPLPDCEE